MSEKKTKAIALYSGGLDSTLAILVMLEQDVMVEAVCFETIFGSRLKREWVEKISNKYGFKVHFLELDENKVIEMVKNPRFGYGKNMNPCVDCRILMLNEAKKLMDKWEASFIITGEVLNQRPLSQKRDTLRIIDKFAGVEGYVLRPLSALLLEPTIPEKKGLVKRELLCAIEGRSRKSQIALAQKFGLSEYPNPAGGCLLTDPIFAFRLKELFSYNPSPKKRDIFLLRVGRHFRLSFYCKAIVGRNEKENKILMESCEDNEIFLNPVGISGPNVLLVGTPKENEINLAAHICARYCHKKDQTQVKIKASRIIRKEKEYKEELVSELKIANIDYDLIESLLIVPKEFQKSL